MNTWRIINKALFVKNENIVVKHRVRITLRRPEKTINGYLIFDNREDSSSLIQRLRSQIRLRYDDAAETEELISLFDIAMIEYM